VLLVAAVTRLATPPAWRTQAADLGVPAGVAAAVPYVEAALGALLLVQFQRVVVAWCAVALLVSFTVLLVVRLAQGRRPPCACFGSLTPKPIGVASVARNVVFIVVASLAATL
jgi:Methylamine utilisation protein MauE